MSKQFSSPSYGNAALRTENFLLKEEVRRLQQNQNGAQRSIVFYSKPQNNKPHGPQVRHSQNGENNSKSFTSCLNTVPPHGSQAHSQNGQKSKSFTSCLNTVPSRTQLNLPPIFKKNASAWFLKVESLFVLRGVVDEVKKYHMILARLSVQELDGYCRYRCFQIVIDGDVTERSYRDLKNAIILIDRAVNKIETIDHAQFTVLHLH